MSKTEINDYSPKVAIINNQVEPRSYYDHNGKFHVDISVEFGYEICVVIPFAYWHFLNGTLGSTASCLDTKCLWPFSINHKEMYPLRVGSLCMNGYNENSYNVYPNSDVEVKNFDYSRWVVPDYKSIYQNKLFVFDKPIMLIMNKYVNEGGVGPKNYITVDALRTLIYLFKDKYQIIYHRYRGEGARDMNWLADTDYTGQYPFSFISHNYKPLQDYEMIKEEFATDVITIEDLLSKYKYLSHNLIQMMIMANAEKFITVSGGTTIFACLFADKTIMFVRDCRDTRTGATQGWYKALHGTEVLHASTDNELLEMAEKLYGN